MKILIVVLFTFLAISLYYFVRLHTAVGYCHNMYEPQLASIRAQSQVALSDKRKACTELYELIGEWEMCLVNTKRLVPIATSPVMNHFISQVQLYLGNTKKDIPLLKIEHDGWCKQYPDILFFGNPE